MNKRQISKISITLAVIVFIMLPTFVSAGPSAGIKPNSIFYFFDIASEKVGLFFTFNLEKKAQKALEHADERLAEAQESANENKPKAVEKAISNYEKKISFATEKSKAIKDEIKAEELLNKVSESTAKHQEILEGVLEKVPEEAREAILNAIEVSKRGQEKALEQIIKLKEEVLELKQKVEELKGGLENKEKDDDKELEDEDDKQTKEIEELKEEVEELRRGTIKNEASVVEARKKQEIETLWAEQRKVDEQMREIEKMKNEKLAEEQRSAELAGQRLQDCLNNNYSKEQLRIATEGAISTLNNSAKQSRQRIKEDYNRQIEDIKSDGQRDLTSARESQRGFATNSAMLKQIQDNIDRSVEDLESRRDELLATVEVNLAQQISDVRIRQLEMERETSEVKCY